MGAWRTLKKTWRRLERSEPWASGVAGGIGLTATVTACLLFGWLYVFGTASEDQLVSEPGPPERKGDVGGGLSGSSSSLAEAKVLLIHDIA
mgnify:CR=1 FL=1